MPDPQRDIAPIIEPAAPPLPPAGPDYTLPAMLVLGGLILFAVLFWHWRRRAPLRTLRKIAQTPDAAAGADALAALVKRQGITPPPFWQEELELLRFGPPTQDAPSLLKHLCQGAAAMLRVKR